MTTMTFDNTCFEKLHKTDYQIKTGKRGKPTTLRNEAWLAGK